MNNIKQDQLINEQIRFREVQVIDEQGNKLGKMNTHEAIDLAEGKDLDLVLVSSNPENPVCKLMDYGKYKFEQSKREKESKKKQKTVEVKEIRVTPNIEEHDFNFKVKPFYDGIAFIGEPFNYEKKWKEKIGLCC